MNEIKITKALWEILENSYIPFAKSIFIYKKKGKNEYIRKELQNPEVANSVLGRVCSKTANYWIDRFMRDPVLNLAFRLSKCYLEK